MNDWEQEREQGTGKCAMGVRYIDETNSSSKKFDAVSNKTYDIKTVFAKLHNKAVLLKNS